MSFLQVLSAFGFTLWYRFEWTGYKKVSKWDYFTDVETEGMNESFMGKLVAARKKTVELYPLGKGIPFRGTSWKRTPEKNKSVIGAIPDSSHLAGLAVDLRVYSGTEVAIIVEACTFAGIRRVGFYYDNTDTLIHLHLDDDPTKPMPCYFVKKEQN